MRKDNAFGPTIFEDAREPSYSRISKVERGSPFSQQRRGKSPVEAGPHDPKLKITRMLGNGRSSTRDSGHRKEGLMRILSREGSWEILSLGDRWGLAIATFGPLLVCWLCGRVSMMCVIGYKPGLTSTVRSIMDGGRDSEATQIQVRDRAQQGGTCTVP